MIVGIIVPGIGEGVGTIFIWILLGKPRRPVFNTGRRVVDPVPSERVIPLITDPELPDVLRPLIVEDQRDDVVVVDVLGHREERGLRNRVLTKRNGRLKFENRVHDEIAIRAHVDPEIRAVSVIASKPTDERLALSTVVVPPPIYPHVSKFVSEEKVGIEIVVVVGASVDPSPIRALLSQSNPQRRRRSICTQIENKS